MRVLLSCLAAMVACSACASMVPSPVTGEYRSDYELASIDVALTDGDKVPDRYDRSINRFMESEDALSDDDVMAFRTFAEGRGGLTETNSGELFLEYLVIQRLEGYLPGFYSGERPAGLEVEIVSTTFPNTATMLLVGEVIGATYEFTLTDAETGSVLVETVEPIFPIVQRSAGAGGGLLGIALRGGGDRHLIDLQRIADGIADEVVAILAGQQIYPGDVDRLAVHAVPDRPAGDPGAMSETVAD